MKNGFQIELLLQLFFIFEGFAFWKMIKLPENVGLTPSDYNEACENILSGSGNAPEKIQQGQQFQNKYKQFKFWQKIISVFDNAYPATIAVIAFILCALFVDFSDNRLFWTNIIVLGYMIIKIIIYIRARCTYSSFQKELNNIPIVENNTVSIVESFRNVKQ